MKKCRWFHRWVFDRLVDVVVPTCGPFDPSSDGQRTFRRRFYVCAKCGASKTEPKYMGDPNQTGIIKEVADENP